MASTSNDATQPAAKRARTLEISDKYVIGKLLGEGAFASVRLATDKSTGALAAAKFIDLRRSKHAMIEREMQVMKRAGQHENIVSLLESFDTPKHSVLVLEYAGGGEVFERIVASGPFSEKKAAHVIEQVGRGLAHLHSKSICHRDVKVENLLYVSVDSDSTIKIADFGLAHDAEHPMADLAGTLAYMSPEALKGERCNTKLDMWALGVVLFTLLSGYLPFDPGGNSGDSLVRTRITRAVPAFTREDGGYPQQWEHVSVAARKLILRLLEREPGKRLSADALLAEPWVRGPSLFTAPVAKLSVDVSATHTR